MIRIDTVWLATTPLDMRARAESPWRALLTPPAAPSRTMPGSLCPAGLKLFIRRWQMPDGVRGLMLTDKPRPSGSLNGMSTFKLQESCHVLQRLNPAAALDGGRNE